MFTRKNVMNLILLFVILLGVTATACTPSEADVASQNVSKEADNFQVLRRIVFINGITDKYLLVIEGYCSLGNNDSPGEVSVTCKTEDGKYMKHFVGISDNVTFVSEQLQPVKVSGFRYKVYFRPETLAPDIDLQTSKQDQP